MKLLNECILSTVVYNLFYRQTAQYSWNWNKHFQKNMTIWLGENRHIFKNQTHGLIVKWHLSQNIYLQISCPTCCESGLICAITMYVLLDMKWSCGNIVGQVGFLPMIGFPFTGRSQEHKHRCQDLLS